MTTDPAYTLPQPLLQAVVAVLNGLPAGQVRALLNSIEAECLRQDRERDRHAAEAHRAQIKSEIDIERLAASVAAAPPPRKKGSANAGTVAQP